MGEAQKAELDGLRRTVSGRAGELMRKHKVQGLSLALVDDQDVVWAEGFGWADREGRIRTTPETVYKVGSITKLFTATAVMQLVEQGKVDLDRPVRDYVPEFSIRPRSPGGPPVSVRMLMTHHAGLPSDDLDGFYAPSADAPPRSFRTVPAYFAARHATFPPEYVFAYSNQAVDLLGVVVERVSGLGFEEYVTWGILEPLGMGSSGLPATRATRPFLAKGYGHGRGAKGVDEPQIRDIPAGGLYSSVLDMTRFMRMVLGGGTLGAGAGGGSGNPSEIGARGACIRILGADTLGAMLTPQNGHVPLDLGFEIGLNWLLTRTALAYAGRVAWHNGGTDHFHSVLVTLPDQKLGAVVLANSANSGAAVEVLADELLREALSCLRGVVSPRPPAGMAATAGGIAGTPPGASVLGRFATLLGLVGIGATRSGPRLVMRGSVFDLIPEAAGWFGLRLRLFGLIPLKVRQVQGLRVAVLEVGRDRVLALEQDVAGNTFRSALGTEYAEGPVPAAWKARVGRYGATTPSALLPGFALRETRGVLSLVASGPGTGRVSWVLDPVSDDEAVVLGLGRGGGETVYARRNTGGPAGARHEELEFLGLEFGRVPSSGVSPASIKSR